MLPESSVCRIIEKKIFKLKGGLGSATGMAVSESDSSSVRQTFKQGTGSGLNLQLEVDSEADLL